MKADAKKYVETLKRKEEAAANETRLKLEALAAQNDKLAADLNSEKQQLISVSEELRVAKDEIAKVYMKTV